MTEVTFVVIHFVSLPDSPMPVQPVAVVSLTRMREFVRTRVRRGIE